MQMIKAEKLGYDYVQVDENGEQTSVTHAISDVDLDVAPGQFIAILGHNGSGKSTLAKHLNALLAPTEGTLFVDGMDTREEENVLAVRQRAGMVFQNPDNQIVAAVVEEDVGFGPENLGVPTEEIWQRVEKSLQATNMTAYRMQSPNRLSGGQKQRVAIAGVMAMEPKCIVLDEPTAMLDPVGRKEVLSAVAALNKEKGVTVILITHYMEEVTGADRILVMDKGRIVMRGTPREIFAQVEALEELRLDVPPVTRLAHLLRADGLELPEGVLTVEELSDALTGLEKKSAAAAEQSGQTEAAAGPEMPEGEETLLALEHVDYIYDAGTAQERYALRDISLEIPRGQFVGLIGHTGSGKSTLIQHFNGLLAPTKGRVTWRGQDIWGEGFNRRELRFHVGLVFQYPEHQLFETDVLTDVCFGPKNQGLSPEECEARARRALTQVGFPEMSLKKSPFEISGGQKRRAAIAGVLAMDPEVLILDEPTAGLDPRGRDEILGQIKELQQERGITVILVSHSMEDMAKFADRVIVLVDGEKRYDEAPQAVFSRLKELEQAGLAAPQMTYLMHALREKGLSVRSNITTIDEARREILALLAAR